MRTRITLALLATLATGPMAQAQTTAPASGKSLASTLNVYVFPNAGQAPAQQSRDEGECYNWAVQNTGSDPFAVAKQQEQQQQQAATQATAAQIDNFKKAFSVCLEAKKYMVKY